MGIMFVIKIRNCVNSCMMILNVPVVYDGVTLGTCNLMHEEGWYDEGDTEIAMTIANIAAPAYLQIKGG